jgi:hypothetical protein
MFTNQDRTCRYVYCRENGDEYLLKNISVNIKDFLLVVWMSIRFWAGCGTVVACVSHL